MTPYLRLADRNNLQTPAYHYVHPDSGRRVTLISAMPIGEAAYYARLTTIINERESEGAVVHREGPDHVPAAEDTSTAEEQKLLADWRRAHRMEANRVALAGLVGHHSGLGHHPHWRYIDVSTLDIIRTAGHRSITDRIRPTLTSPDWPLDDPRPIYAFRLLITIGLRLDAITARLGTPPRHRRGFEIVVARRTAVALDGVAATRQDVVLVWHAAYSPSLDTGLRNTGYQRIRTDWYTAITLPTISRACQDLIRNPEPTQPWGQRHHEREPSRRPRHHP